MPSKNLISTTTYTEQLSDKIESFKQSLEVLGKDSDVNSLEVFTSSEQFYRMRAEFKVWHQGNTAQYAMSDPETKKPIFIEQFPIAAKSINDLMPEIMTAINEDERLRKKCFQVEFLSTLTNDTLVTLIYHRKLDDEWIQAITPVKERLGIHIIGRSRKQKIVLDRDYVNECLTVNGEKFHYQQVEGSFTQPNAKVCEKMLSWAVNNSHAIGDDLLELYCGNGNFTLPLSKNFTRVLATEISKTSVRSALENISRNNIDNVLIMRMSSEEFVQAMDKTRVFRRLEGINLDDYEFSTVFVDPPRAGLDPETVKMVQRFANIIYISCNPETLIDNLQELCQTHKIEALAAFDQFPYTHHLEAGVILSKK